MLAQRLRWLAERSDWGTANRLFKEIAARSGNDPVANAFLASAALRAARDAEADGRPMAAARSWVWYATVSREISKGSRNLIRYARHLTQARHDRKAVSNALQVWQLLAVLEPSSAEARRGTMWCRAALAQRAEQAGDFITAQSQWSAVLDMAPNDAAAKEGLRRSLAHGALAAPGSSSPATQSLSKRFKRIANSGYASYCATGKGLLQAGAPELAIRYVETALKERKGPEAAALHFRCYMALRRYRDAAVALNVAFAIGPLNDVPAAELVEVLANAPRETIGNETLVALAKGAKPDEIASALAPHLVRRDLRGALRALARNITVATPEWRPSDAIAAVDFLWHSGDEQWALRLLAVLSALTPISDAFAARFESLDLERLRDVLLAAPGQDFFLPGGLFVAECYRRKGNVSSALEVLSQLSSNEHFAEQFHAGCRDRIARLVAGLQAGMAPGCDVWRQLAELVSSWVSNEAKAFFASDRFERVRDAIAAERRLQNAPLTSRMGYFREHYFAHHLERRENQDPDAIASDFALCEIALRYFDGVSKMRPVEEIPVTAEMRARLGRPSLSFGENHSADVLMSYALLRQGPKYDLGSSELIDELMAWYVGRFMPDNKIPGSCLSAPVQDHFNRVGHDHAAFGIAATHFTRFIVPEVSGSAARYDLANPLDALVFALEAFAQVMPSKPHYRPFLAAMFPYRHGRSSFADTCIEVLSSGKSGGISQLLGGVSALPARVSRSLAASDAQDVLVIGHTNAGTGLARNFEMLTDALRGSGTTKLATVGYDLDPETFAEELRQWHSGCRGIPVVIAAVNAQDVPSLFVRDRHNVLDGCHFVGFFLWETSRPPRVQDLGIRVADEIWTPTEYVADVYAPFAPVHVVGKGLFGETAPIAREQHKNGPMRFLTVFDFHSSIERKNPLASVLAFQRAFQAGENVQLIIKASNVNAQHPGNAYGQWERLCGVSAGDARIRIITERYTEEQMERLIAGVSCVVSLHRAEGFGYVLMDAMAAGIPVIATDYSGNLDFCDQETSFPVSYRLVPVRSNGAYWETDGAEWADADVDSAAAQMRAVYSDYAAALRKAARGRERVLIKYSKERFRKILQGRLSAALQPESVRHADEQVYRA